MKKNEHYTFGDTELAARRLALLARVFEPSSTQLFGSLAPVEGKLGLDFGSGPGHTTRLVADSTSLEHVIGLDQSAKLLEVAACRHADARLSFVQCDVTRLPLPTPRALLLYSRFLLTHLRDPARVVSAWAYAALPGARLVLEETASMRGEHPAFSRYYALVEQMQAHYGQRMYVGKELAAIAREAAPLWTIERAEIAVSELPATNMAELHAMNLRTWSNDAFARANYDPEELAELERTLARIAIGEISTGPVVLGMGQVVLRRG
ncbi:MAG TPA: class I SAM-dependent methyltransferase [Polyangiaceae bacterium]|jgi:SAM-dependent methyltransferase|nr:class I SAM-dependent methyltransferase [Polyangiaceae bacterium]